jgi:PEP-CTERM motif
MKLSAVPFAVLLAFVACFSIGEASATPITVNNSSFETLGPGGLPLAGCGPGCSFSTSPTPGWNGGTGQFQPGPSSGNFAYLNSVPDGVTVGYVNGGDTPLTQTVGAIVQDGVTYTLTVEIGTRHDSGFGGSADLVIGGVDFLATGTPAAAGDWATYTATFTGTSGTAGQSIAIQLNGIGVQGDFDNVELTDNVSSNVGSAVPEPSSISLLTLGLGGLAGVVRRKFRS